MRSAFFAAFTALAVISTGCANAQTTSEPPAARAAYQAPDQAAQRAALDRLAPLLGDWRGEAQVSFPRPAFVHQNEQVTRELGGLAILVRGTGYAEAGRTGAPVFQALAVITYDERRQLYNFRTYSGGHAADATGEFLPDGSFRWSLEAGPMRMRYTLSFTPETWTEIGESSRDGQTWTRTIEMNLSRAR